MTDSKTATERLRELLDERGVEYRTEEYMGMPVTFFEHGGQRWSITSHPDGYMIVNSVNYSPEQAIAATLGSGRLTAEQVRKAPDWAGFFASIEAVAR